MRSSVSSRVYVLGFNAFWCGNLVRLTVHGGWPPSPRLALLRVLGIALASSYTYRRLKVGFDADGATLVVRNLFRTRRMELTRLRGHHVVADELEDVRRGAVRRG